MAKYYHKCSVCNKTVKKKKPNFKGIIICNDCKRERNTIECLNCGKLFYKVNAKRKFCSKKCFGEYNGKYVLKGRKLSNETKEKLSKIGYYSHTSSTKCKFYKIYNPLINEDILVQGTYELAYAKYLNKNKINWIRNSKIVLQYKRDVDDITRNYFPDFYLPERNEYIEIKGRFFKNDKIKMKLVKQQNPNKKIIILFKNDLVSMGIL
ncbi:MAG: hypothetical protein ACOCP8_07160 [archaeon]